MENKIQLTPLTSAELTLIVREGERHTASSATDVFTSKNLNFQSLNRSPRIEDIETVIHKEVYLQMFVIWPNEGDKLTPLSVAFTTFILNDKPEWKINDISLFFKFILRRPQTQENKQFRRLDMMYLTFLITEYEEWKADELEAYRRKQAQDDKNPHFYHPNYIKMIKEVLEATKVKPVPKVPRLKTPAEILVQGWMRKFDAINRDHPVIDKDGMKTRFINRYGKVLDMEEYLFFKQVQYGIVVKRLERRRKKNK